jgi:hypothetical protein
MNQDEFKKLRMTVVDMLCGDDLVDKTPRTLLYGGQFYHVHTYFDGVDIRMCGWDMYEDEVCELSPSSNEHYIPEYLVHPQYCDLEFCQLLLKAGERIPFGEWHVDKQELRTL